MSQKPLLEDSKTQRAGFKEYLRNVTNLRNILLHGFNLDENVILMFVALAAKVKLLSNK